MIINGQTLDLAFKGFKTIYSEAFEAAETHYDKVAMTVPSSSRDETYGWIGQFPQLREWVGPRHVKNLAAHGFAITNRTFESTVAVKRADVEDDRLGIFKPMFAEMGTFARRHPEELVFSLLKDGFSSPSFDGTTFFAEDHELEIDGEKVTDSNDPHVFMNDQYLYGVRARVNAGFGLWQLAYGSKSELTIGSYAAARAAMMDFRSDGGRILGVKPTVLVVPPSLETQGLQILNALLTEQGGSNVWANTAQLIVTPYVKA